MIDGAPGYVSPVFIATTFLTVGFLFYAVRSAGTDTFPAKLILFLVSFWLIYQAVAATGGFYLVTDAVPPRIFAFAALPALSLAVLYLVFFRKNFVERLPLKVLTLLHVIRVPVEIVLLWLFQAGLVPEAMTFEGTNFDILSGLSAPIVYLFAFRGNRVNKTLLVVWNVAALALLINIVSIAVMSFPSPLQTMAFEQPNRAVAFFPYVWLPAVVVPIVFFSHIASLWKLSQNKIN